MNSPPILPQLTVKAILLGIILSAVLAGANAYLGLFAGLTVSASIPAAVISMAILRMFKNSNILENNIVQTAASAGESLAAGVIFTIPALIIFGYWDVFDYWWVSAIAGLGGLLGVLFTIPLRRSLIVEQKLAYPEGVATAEVLKVGDDPSGGIRYLAMAAVTGALIKFCSTGLHAITGAAQTARYFGNSTIGFLGINLSPALISVGFIVGLNISVLIFAGGAISWYVGIPIFSAFFLDSSPDLAAMFAAGDSAEDLAGAIWSQQIRYLGVGAMVVGGVWALISMRASLFDGVRSGLAQYKAGPSVATSHTDMDVPMKFVLVGIAVFVIPIFVLYQNIVGQLTVSFAMTLIMVVAGFLFSSVAGYMAGLVGSSNNPISGITIATILFASLVLLAMLGTDSVVGPSAAIMIGGVVCCAAAIAGDNMQDLKAGYILGATPWKQQVMQAVGTVSAVLVIAPILNLLLQAYGIGVPTAEHPNPLAAPQATLMASVAQGVFHGGLPWTMAFIGAVVGVLIIVADEALKSRGSSFRMPVLAVAVGIYLPLELSSAILVGGLVAHFAARVHAKRGVDGEKSMRHGMLFAAGLITGEALVGILMAIPIVKSGNPDVFALDESLQFGGGVGLAVIAVVCIWMYRVSAAKES
ncbi:MAG: oligopeptide transporter, OPT family [Proteobacteria bacterium]|nr:oligopeptide transporter, OPT family [Pseudomonadota bacterium]MDA0992355.1 oligopeptide transporter, OPT family [Pseudomonadota bacterium]